MMKTTGQVITELLEMNNMSQRTLAEKVGVSEVTISRYTNSARQPKSDILQKIALALNVSTDYLLGLTNKDYVLGLNNTEKQLDRMSKILSADESLYSFMQELIKRENLQLLFSQVKDLTDEEIKAIIGVIKTIEDAKKH